MKKTLLAALASLTVATACKKDDTTTPAVTTMQVSGTLAGANEVPTITPVAGANGSFTGTYDPSTKTLSYTLTFAGLSGNATAAHLHYGDAKHSGSVWLPFSNVPAATSGTVTGTAILTTTAATSTSKAASQPDSLTMGHVYANVHTANNPGGEIRATVVVK